MELNSRDGRGSLARLVLAALAAPFVGAVFAVAIGSSEAHRGDPVDRFRDVVSAGRVACRQGVFVPSPSGRSYSCPYGGEFRCEVSVCELYAGERNPRERWVMTTDEKTGVKSLVRGGTRLLKKEIWYGSIPAKNR